MNVGRGVKVVAAGAALLLAVVGVGNIQSLREGVVYLRQMSGWRPESVKPIDPAGRFGMCHDLVRLANSGRYDLIVRSLRERGLEPVLIPVPGEPEPDVLVLFGSTGPYTLFDAHYDKSRETPSYQGASDNTAAVCVLLAAARDLAERAPVRPTALLFTAGEEDGFKGAHAFVDWSRARDLELGEVINFDMLGRGKIASRPMARAGFYFWLPGVGEMLYDGRRVARGTSFPLPDARLVRRIADVLGQNLVAYRRFTAYSDSEVYQAAGLPTVSLSSDDMYYLDLVWERDSDRIELLDEDNLALAARFVVDYVRTSRG